MHIVLPKTRIHLTKIASQTLGKASQQNLLTFRACPRAPTLKASRDSSFSFSTSTTQRSGSRRLPNQPLSQALSLPYLYSATSYTPLSIANFTRHTTHTSANNPTIPATSSARVIPYAPAASTDSAVFNPAHKTPDPPQAHSTSPAPPQPHSAMASDDDLSLIHI